MIGAFQATLYDLFGYFLPGAVGLVGLSLVFWRIFHSAVDTVKLQGAGNGVAIAVFLVGSYLLGHVIHNIGSWLMQGFRRPEDFVGTGAHHHGLSPALRRLIRSELEKRLGIEALQMPAREQYGYMDESRALTEKEGNREVYLYLEGFYIGMTAASLLLTIGLLLRFTADTSICIELSGRFCMSPDETLALAVLSLVSLVTFVQGVDRFAHYRFERAALLWLSQPPKEETDDEPESAKPSLGLFRFLRGFWRK